MMHYCNNLLYRYNHQEQRDVWFACGICALCKAYEVTPLTIEAEAIPWKRIKQFYQNYFLQIEEVTLDEAIMCQDPQSTPVYDFDTCVDSVEYVSCGCCPRCERRHAQHEQEIRDEAEAASYW